MSLRSPQHHVDDGPLESNSTRVNRTNYYAVAVAIYGMKLLSGAFELVVGLILAGAIFESSFGRLGSLE